MDRRRFLAELSAAAACAVAWFKSGGLASSPTATALNRAPTCLEPDAAAAFQRLIRILLPFEHPQFPAALGAEIVFERAVTFASGICVPFGASLALFDNVSGFSTPSLPMLAREREILLKELSSARTSLALQRAQAEDASSFTNLFGSEPRAKRASSVKPLSLEEQRGYYGLWLHSALSVRRQFAQSSKIIVMAAAYSTEELWHAIGYAGPLLHRGANG